MEKFRFLAPILFLMFASCNHEERQKELNQIQICAFDFMNSNSDPATKPNSAIINWPRWEIGQTIKIKFLDGNEVQHEKVKKYASEWTKYANLKFEYVSSGYADIRIGFNRAGESNLDFGAWSVLGMRSAYGNTDAQSMRLGPLNSTDESSVSRTVLHEFGHALGLVHENASPASKINWNLAKVYQYYSELNGWSKDEVDRYVIKTPESTNYSQYDALSIMHYYIPAALTTDGKSVNEMSVLSDIDKKSINQWYPFPFVSVMESGQSFNDLRWKDRIQSNNKRYSLEFTPGFLRIIDLVEKKIIWEVGNIRYPRRAICNFESNGNIILKGAKYTASTIETIWTSNTSEYPGATLQLQDDGDLQLIYNGTVKWSSKNGKV
ncbi:matrixin family metalloprotease [Flavobacterium sp. LHD-85]|uniref:matrixin family metalloprotease n=1 Tax=Flavobacterium sp. LHD-85 TaxID=3071410 RepID=UPI0027E18A68|nr:matrixin family metalloprotease [Flavobacterium sp. LHD-85]MDQ6527638.1 matrixin family metalloprotease [Flavobacterium sp. LHD-85]